jgi:hypothetical protein
MNIDITLVSKLASIVYEKKRYIYLEAEKMGFDYNDITIIDEPNIRCAIFSKNNNKIIAFRGSDNKPNWLNNFKIKKKQTFKGGVHRGFWEYKNKFIDEIKMNISQDDNLYLAGHSLGAALASLISNNLYEDGYRKIIFGLFIECPNVFNKRYKRNTKHYNIHRIFVKNNIDMVKRMPPRWLGYTNYSPKDTENCDLIYFNRKDMAIINPSKTGISLDKLQTYINPVNWFDTVSDHFIAYVLSLMIKNREIIEELI